MTAAETTKEDQRTKRDFFMAMMFYYDNAHDISCKLIKFTKKSSESNQWEDNMIIKTLDTDDEDRIRGAWLLKNKLLLMGEFTLNEFDFDLKQLRQTFCYDLPFGDGIWVILCMR